MEAKKITPQVELIYPYSFKLHKVYDIKDDKVSFLCFCKSEDGQNCPMVASSKGLRCASNKCKFKVSTQVTKLYFNNDVFKGPIVRIPVCKTCAGCTFDCYSTKLYPTYFLKPRFMCGCTEQMNVTPSLYGKEKMEEYFNIKEEGAIKKIDAATVSQLLDTLPDIE